MDATTLVGSLTGAAAVIGAVVAYLGKKGENALSGYTSLTDQLQEERTEQQRLITDLRQQLVDRDARIAELAAHRSEDQAELTRLHNLVQALGGQP